MIRAAGRDWGTDREIAERLGDDVTPAMVRRWHDRKGLERVAGLYPLDQAAEIEHATRTSGKGCKRGTRHAPRRRLDPEPAAA